MEKLISNVVKAQQTTELSCQHTMKLISVLFRIFGQFFILAVDLECKKGGLRSVVTHANCKMQFLCRFNILLPKDYHIGHTEMFHWIEWSKRGGASLQCRHSAHDFVPPSPASVFSSWWELFLSVGHGVICSTAVYGISYEGKAQYEQ